MHLVRHKGRVARLVNLGFLTFSLRTSFMPNDTFDLRFKCASRMASALSFEQSFLYCALDK